MSTIQTGFDRFEESTEETNGTDANPWDFDEYGPTMDEPAELVAPSEFDGAMYDSGGEPVDRREIPDSGLSLSDMTDWPSQKREEDRPDRIEEWAEIAAKVDPRGGEEPHPDAGADQETVATDGGVAAADFEELHELPRGAVLSLDKRSGLFMVVNLQRTTPETVVAVDVIDENGTEYRLQHVAMGEHYFDMSQGHDTAAVKNTANIDDVRDFEVVGRDQEWLEDYLAEKYPHVGQST